MRKKLLSILALTILVTSTLVGCSGAPSTASTLTILSITEGDVFVMKAGADDWTEATVEMSLEVGDTIKTGDDSGAEITFFDGSTLELEAGTQIEITSLYSSPDTGAKTITLMQTIGTTVSRVTKLLDPASSYAIETQSGVAAVRGSTMIVRIIFDDPNYEDGTILITNVEGDIYAIVQGVELQIPKGRTCIIRLDQLAELLSLDELELAVDDSAVTDEDTSVTVAAPGVLDNDSGLVAGDTLAVTAVDTSGTVGAVTTWSVDGSFTYDPDGQFEYLQAGNSTTDSFTYTVTDDYGITDTATVTITINGVNDAPTDISLDNSSVAENQYYGTAVGDFSTTDPDTGDTFAYSLVSGEGGGGNGWFMIVGSQLRAAASFDYEARNSYSIRVRTTDSGGLSYEEAFIITIADVYEPPVNNPPVALDDSATTSQNTSVTIDVLSNDSDPDNDALTVGSVTQGAHGLVINNGSNVSYTPNSGFSGTDSFTYIVSDGHGGTDTATVSVDILGPAIAINKTGELVWHEEGFYSSIKYTFTITNPGNTPLSDISVTDGMFEQVPYQSGDTNEDDILDTDETWIFTATYDLYGEEESPLFNTATVSGTDPLSLSVWSESSTTVDILRPAIGIYKTGELLSDELEQQYISYNYTVTNPGNTPLSDISVTDDMIEEVTHQSGDTNENGLLDTDETWVFTATYYPTGEDPDPVENYAFAYGTDPLGHTVTAEAYFSIYNPYWY